MVSWQIDDLFPHPFNPEDWDDSVTQERLISELVIYQNEFQVQSWDRSDINNFLIVFFHLVKGKTKRNHYRTILTIIQGEN